MDKFRSLPFQDKVCVNSYAAKCFRDVADRDYISARALFQLDLVENFYWSAAQAIEKYLKGILLFNYESTKDGNHKLLEMYTAVKRFGYSGLSSFEDDFISKFSKQSKPSIRYAQIPIHCYGPILTDFDHFVWSIRRYCQQFYIEVDGIDPLEWRNEILAAVAGVDCTANPHKFGIIGGLLESILRKGPRDKQRASLIWMNPYYSSKKVNVTRENEKYIYKSEFWQDHPECQSILHKVVKR